MGSRLLTAIRERAVAVDGVESAEVSWESGRAEVFGSAEGAALVEAVECTGKDAVLESTPADAAPQPGRVLDPYRNFVRHSPIHLPLANNATPLLRSEGGSLGRSKHVRAVCVVVGVV